MPEQRTTLAELLKFNDRSLAELDVSDIIFAGSMLSVLHAQPSSNGTVHKYYKQVTAPVIGFRKANAPKTSQPGVKEQVSIDLEFLEATVEEDVKIARGYIHGEEAFMAKRGLENLTEAFHHAEVQFIYGTGNDADGFVGMAEATGYTALADEKVIGGGGTGTDVESIWIVRTGEDDLSAVSNGEESLEIGEIYRQQLNAYDVSDNVIGTFSGLVAEIHSHFGLQLGSIHSLVRIANVDTTSNTVEDLVQDGLELFPSTKQPTHIFLSRRARRAISRGRQKTATENRRVPRAMDVDEIPLVISEALGPETAIL